MGSLGSCRHELDGRVTAVVSDACPVSVGPGTLRVCMLQFQLRLHVWVRSTRTALSRGVLVL